MGIRDNPPGLIQTGQVAQRLRTAYGVRGKAVTPRLGDQLHPTVLVDDLAHPEWFANSLSRRAYYTDQVAPVAGQNGYITIANPLGSGVLIFLESFHCIGTPGTVIIGRVTGAEPATISAGQYFDDRLGLFSTVCRLRQGTNAVLQIASPFYRLNTGPSPGHNGHILIGAVLQPGGLAWGIQHATVNVQLDAGFTWIERPLEI